MRLLFCLLLTALILHLSYSQPFYIYSQTFQQAYLNARGVSVSGNQITIAAASQDQFSRTYSFNNTAYLWAWSVAEAIPDPLFAVNMNWNGLLMITGDIKGKVRTYSCTTAAICTYNATLDADGIVMSIRMSDSNTQIAVGDMASSLSLYTGSGYGTKNKLTPGNCNGILSVAFPSTTANIGAGCVSGNVLVYRWSSGYSVYKNLTHSSMPVFCVDFADDAGTMIAGSADSNVRIYKGVNANFNNVGQTLSDATDAVTACVISGDANIIATASRDKVLRIYYNSGSTYTLAQTFSDATEPLWSLSISTNNSVIVTGSDDAVVRVYQVCTNSSCFACPTGCVTCLSPTNCTACE